MSPEALCRRHMSRQHLEVLAQYMERYPALALAAARSREGHLRSQRLWDKIARTLNRIQDGVSKDGRSWSRYWYDFKFKIRRKYMLLQKCAAEGNPRGVQLNPVEQRVVRLLTDKDGNLLPPASLTLRPYYTVPRPGANTHTNTRILNANSKDSDTDSKINDSGGPETIECDAIDSPDYLPPTDKRKQTRQHTRNIQDRLEDPIQILLPEEKKSVEELRVELVEFELQKQKQLLELELQKQKQLLELELQQRREKHELELDILRIKKQIMMKELKKL